MNKFIVFEGIDGSGKTTQAKLLADYLNGIYTCEPTNGEIGQLIRKVLGGKNCEKESLALLFAGDRVEHIKEIEHKLIENMVICDRYVYSSMVYQSIQGIDIDFIASINRFAKIPDVLIYLDVSIEESLKRMGDRDSKEIFENKEILQKVNKKYMNIINERLFEPKNGYILINTDNKTVEEVHKEIIKKLMDKKIIL
ncbi:dTMP kinase [Methanococcus aeolicus Nankai-3]|uniref:Probable thymidylate kinase n=1 Tax=Methanococcus aeolicus (strain ATCC BAA-1280 / DSM 17508 / OCM 812 / Nankai-3) TaxID=419665 RepID=KTHY_META3|nr:dTMP kinase [Methanococcus aeolicus]A6UTV9.1 RecName: Full=Probable thymidylate kinase; AltName: Full=dTMP kinase [Methanococcus aeolicus Nankai-3]ABR55931.1 dTMP kinase [Methanococcus aeolicus Nankai-3]